MTWAFLLLPAYHPERPSLALPWPALAAFYVALLLFAGEVVGE